MNPRDPQAMSIHRGPHVVGWSNQGDRAPKSTTNVELGGRDVLYNPRGDICYWATTTTYGSAPAYKRREIAIDGPLPLREVHALKQIDDWFRSSPRSQNLDQRGYKINVSIVRDETCTTLVQRGCRDEVPNLHTCYRAGDTQEHADHCLEVASARCDRSLGVVHEEPESRSLQEHEPPPPPRRK